MSKRTGTKKTFSAKAKAIGPSGAWTQMQMPFDVEKEWGCRARVSVRGVMNGFVFRTSIFPDGKGGHTMMVNKAMKENGGAIPGKTVRVELQPDSAPRPVIVP
jgi:hypothetical protein